MSTWIQQVTTTAFIPTFTPAGTLFYAQDTGALWMGTGYTLGSDVGVVGGVNIEQVGGSGGGPGGFNGDIQYNNNGALGGSAASITAAGTINIPTGQNYEINGVPIGSSAWAALTGDLTSTQVIPFDGSVVGTPDTGISRISAGVLGIGNGSAGDFSGSLSLANATHTSVNATPGTASSTAGFVLLQNTTPTVTGASTTVAIKTGTAPINVTGNTWRYTFAATESGAGSNAWVGASVTISGYTTTATGNNGTFGIIASTTTTFDVVNATGTTADGGTPVVISSAVVNSPILQLAGTVNTGTAGTLNSVADVWSIQNVIGQLVPNPTSTLTFTHSGSTGPKVISIPSGTSIEVVSSGVALTLGSGNFASLSNGQANGQLAIVTAGAEIPSGAVYAISSTTSVSGTIDTGISRLAAASLAIGNGTAGDESGSLTLKSVTLSDTAANVDFLAQNTTTATSTTTCASPLLEVAANYWTGSASAADTWTVGSSLAAGTNGASTLTFAHSGSTGIAAISIPETTGKATLQLGGTVTNGIGAGSASTNLGLYAGASLQFYFGGTEGAFMALGSGSVGMQFSSSGTNGAFTLGGGLSTGTNLAEVNLGGQSTGAISATSGTNAGVSISNTGGLSWSWAPTTGTGSFIGLYVNPTINQTGGTGNYTGLGVYPYVEAVAGTTPYLIAAGTASASALTATLTNKFTVDPSGNAEFAGAVVGGSLIVTTATVSSTLYGGVYWSGSSVGLSETGTALTSITTLGGLVISTSDVSDERLKEGTPYTGGLDTVLAIHPMRYKWNTLGEKETGISHGRPTIGFYAQDVQKAIPEAVWESRNGYLGFDSRPVIAALVNAVKELTARVKQLEATA